MTNLDSILKSRDITLSNKGPSSQGYSFSSSHVWMWELACKESWAPKNWCFWTVVLDKTLESPLDCKKIQPVHPKGDQSWVFIWRTDVEAETPILWPPHAKSWLIGKDPDAWKDWGQEEKGMTEDKMSSSIQWTWVWVASGSWWWTGRPGLLWSMGSQRVGHDWATELKEAKVARSEWARDGGRRSREGAGTTSCEAFADSGKDSFCLLVRREVSRQWWAESERTDIGFKRITLGELPWYSNG